MLIIDLREENEILNLNIKPKDNKIRIINIPSRFIYFNQEWIKNQSETKMIGLLCATGNRSLQIKKKYFKEVENIQVIKSENNENLIYEKNDKILNFGLTQYMQSIFIIILLSILIINYYSLLNLNLYIISIILVIFYQIYFKTCWLNKLIPFR